MIIGNMHNNGLRYLDSINYSPSITTQITQLTNGVDSFFYNRQGHMTLSSTTKGYSTDLLTSISTNFIKNTADSVTSSWVNQIIPTVTVNEGNLLTSSLNIFSFDSTQVTSIDSSFATVLSRANALLTTYNGMTWQSNNGDAIGGYLRIVISSTTYWKNYYDSTGQGNVQNAGGPGPGFVKTLVSWFKKLALPEADAAGYIFGWGKSWLWDQKPTATERIKDGVGSAIKLSGFGAITQ